MAYVEDRWVHKKTKARTERWGHGKRWRVRDKGPDGRERSESFDREADAKAFRDKVGTELRKGTWVDPGLGETTLRELAAMWLETIGGEANTRERVTSRVQGHIVPKLGDYTLTVLSQRPSIIAKWLAALPLQNNPKRDVLGHLSSMLASAVDDGMMTRNPCQSSSVKPPRAGRGRLVAWPQEWADAMREMLPERYKATVDLGVGLGLRQGEVFGLYPTDVNWLRGDVDVQRQVRVVGGELCFAPPKGGKNRNVPLPESVKLKLAAHLERFPAVPVTLPWREPGGKPRTERLIVTTLGGKAARARDFNEDRWRPARRAAGIPDRRENGFHALRHLFASLLLADRVDIRKLAVYLGHDDPGFTVRRYGHFIPDGGETMRHAIDTAFGPDAKGPATAQEAAGGGN